MNVGYIQLINSNYFIKKSSLSLKTISNKIVVIAILAIASNAIMCIKNYMRKKKFDNQKNETENSSYNQTQTKCQTQAGILNSKNQETLSSSSPKSNLNQEFLLTEAIVCDINSKNKTLSEAEWKSINLSKYSSALVLQLIKHHYHLQFLAPKTVAENLKRIPIYYYFMLTNEQINQIDFSTLSGEQYLEIEKVILNKKQSIDSSKFIQLDFANFKSENIKFIQSKKLLPLIPPQTIASHFEKFEHILNYLGKNQIDALDMNQLSFDTIIKFSFDSVSDKQWQSLDLNSYTSGEIKKLLKNFSNCSKNLSCKTILENISKFPPEEDVQFDQLKKLDFSVLTGDQFLKISEFISYLDPDKQEQLNLDYFNSDEIEESIENDFFSTNYLSVKTILKNLSKFSNNLKHFSDKQFNEIDFSQLTGDQFIRIMNDNLIYKFSLDKHYSKLNLDKFNTAHIQAMAGMADMAGGLGVLFKKIIPNLSPKTIGDNIEKFDDKSLTRITRYQIKALDLNQLSSETLIKLPTTFNYYINKSQHWNSFDLSKHDPAYIEKLLIRYPGALNKISAESVGKNLFKIPPEYYYELTNEQLKKVNYFLLNDEQLKKISFTQMSAVDFLKLATSKHAICKEKAKELNLDLFTEAQIENMSDNIIHDLNSITVAANIKKFSPNKVKFLMFEQIWYLDINQLSIEQFKKIDIGWINKKQWEILDLAKFSENEIFHILSLGIYCKDKKIIPNLHKTTVALNFPKIPVEYWKDLTIDQITEIKKIPENLSVIKAEFPGFGIWGVN